MALRVLFIATREPSYPRVSIIHDALTEQFEVTSILSQHQRYYRRLIHVIWQFISAWRRGHLRDIDIVFVGFMAQPIVPLIRLFWRGKLATDAFFSLYDTMVYDKCWTRPNSIMARFCFWLDRFMVRQSDICFTLRRRQIFRPHSAVVPNLSALRCYCNSLKVFYGNP